MPFAEGRLLGLGRQLDGDFGHVHRQAFRADGNARRHGPQEGPKPATSDHSSSHPYALRNNTSSALACTDLRQLAACFRSPNTVAILERFTQTR